MTVPVGVRRIEPVPRADIEESWLQACARFALDLDRCEHGRHIGDLCHACPGGSSLGNPVARGIHLPDTEVGVVVAFASDGRPWCIPHDMTPTGPHVVPSPVQDRDMRR